MENLSYPSSGNVNNSLSGKQKKKSKKQNPIKQLYSMLLNTLEKEDSKEEGTKILK